MMTMKFKGYIQVYTGSGKGKTTAALGLALRAAGRGKKTYIAQFMKKGEYGELLSTAKYLKDFITIEQFGLPDFHYTGANVTAEEREAAQAGAAAVNEAIESKKYDIIILDEVNVLLYFKIISPEPILKIIDEKPENIELVLTGRNAPEDILKRADLITEMKEIKHYYKKNVPARLGIEK
jgi:cob(I)alamin adenosyltransferase